ncbi:MAG TPA: SRPBCC family protein [Rhizomicrobium sp.]
MTDITVHQTFDRAPATVARIMFDPKNDTKWIDGAKKVEPFDQNPTQIGTRVKRHGTFWGRNFSWVTETNAYEADRKLALKYVEGPLTGEVIYEIAADGAGSKVTVRQLGATLAMPGTEVFLKRTLQSDLKRLKALVERQPRP